MSDEYEHPRRIEHLIGQAIVRDVRRSEPPDLVERADYEAMTERFYKVREQHTALRAALASLEQQTRQRGLAACPNVQPPASGWSAIDMHSRTIGAVLSELADQIAALLKEH